MAIVLGLDDASLIDATRLVGKRSPADRTNAQESGVG
jgi:hypothetical protein